MQFQITVKLVCSKRFFGSSTYIPYICIMRYKRKKGTSIVRSKKKKPEYNGITFDSNLEVVMYKLLESSDISFEYTPKSFTLIEGFLFDNDSYERRMNGKDEFKNRGHSKVRPMTYKPDFIVGDEDFIVEVKGWANETFPIRWKLFKEKLFKEKSKSVLMKPQTQKECQECLNIIVDFYDKKR